MTAITTRTHVNRGKLPYALLLAGILVGLATLEPVGLSAGTATGDTERVSLGGLGGEADDLSRRPAISANGRFVSFQSTATDLVFDDSNGVRDIFVHDRQAGQTERVSVDSLGGEADLDSSISDISGDGSFVAFDSAATNLVIDDTNGRQDIFVHNRQIGETTRISVDSLGGEGDGGSERPVISNDGRFIAFDSNAANMVPDDTNGKSDVFVHDRQTGQTTRVSVDSLGTETDDESHDAAISADGRFVAFESEATNLVIDDTNGRQDVFVHDRQTGETTRVSVDSLGGEADFNVFDPALSDDGRFVTFDSFATGLVAGDTNAANDVFVRDRQTGETTRVSVDSLGDQGDAGSLLADISGDGSFVVFHSDATDLVAGDANGIRDVFVHDRQTGQTARVSLDSLGGESDGASERPSISDDGRFVAFESIATDLVAGDTNGVRDIFVHDRGVVITLAQGDNDCDGDADPVDALKGLQHVAAINFTQEPDCPTLGDALPAALPAGAALALFGDVDCDDDVDSVDALKILRSVAALSVTQSEPCTDIGDPL